MPLEKAFDRHGILIYPWYISDQVATKEIGRLAGGRTIREVFFYIRDDKTTLYYDRGSTDILGRWILQQIIKNHNFYRQVISKIYDYSAALTAFGQGLKKLAPAGMSDRALLKIYAQYEKKLGTLRVWGWVPPILDGVFEPFLSDYLMGKLTIFLQNRGQAGQVANYYSLLSSSEKMSEVQTESLARLRLLLAIKSSRFGAAAIRALIQEESQDWEEKFPIAARLLNKHLKKFGWLTYSYAGPVMSFDYLFKALSADLKNGDVASQIRKITKHFRTIKAQKAKLRARLRLPAELTYLLAVSSELMFIKDYRKGVYQKSYVAMDQLIAELARRLGLSNREIRNLILAEIKDALLYNKQAAYRRRARQRLKLAAYTAKQGKIKVFEGRQARNLISRIESHQRPLVIKATELKGSIAYPGLVRGRVKIILTKNDVPKLQVGDILVSSATNPDLIAAMKKAAAFVTDTGGIICHAAIVARELKKPCVIGTKIATQVLHDGDEVEVDANHGIVKILKS